MINKQMFDLSSQLMPLKQRFERLQKRERQLVMAGTLVVLFIIFYSLIWEPVFVERDTLRQRVQDQSQLLNWMKDKTQDIKNLQAAGGQSSARFDSQPTSSLIERSALSMGTKAYIKKQTSDKKGIKINLEMANFDRVILWLDDMASKYGIHASNIKIEKLDNPGSVNVRVTLERNK